VREEANVRFGARGLKVDIAGIKPSADSRRFQWATVRRHTAMRGN
jgi:hypothetical protein